MKPVAVILAGGQSSRMGEDKALIKLDGVEQWRRLYDMLAPLFDEVVMSRRADQPNAFIEGPQLVFDFEVGAGGPAAGILAAHARFPRRALFIVSVDLFSLTPASISFLLSARDASYDATLVCDKSGSALPFPGIWEASAASAFAREASNFQMSPRRFLLTRRCKTVSPEQLEVFADCNTPSELARLKK